MSIDSHTASKILYVAMAVEESAKALNNLLIERQTSIPKNDKAALSRMHLRLHRYAGNLRKLTDDLQEDNPS